MRKIRGMAFMNALLHLLLTHKQNVHAFALLWIFVDGEFHNYTGRVLLFDFKLL